jgi:hypothetical protein
LRLGENIHAPYYALAIVGPVANVIEIALTTKTNKTKPVAKTELVAA